MSTCFLHGGFHCLSRRRIAIVGEQNMRARLRQRLDNRPPDPTAAAGDNGPFVFKLSIHGLRFAFSCYKLPLEICHNILHGIANTATVTNDDIIKTGIFGRTIIYTTGISRAFATLANAVTLLVSRSGAMLCTGKATQG
jgi:hypothetical protein